MGLVETSNEIRLYSTLWTRRHCIEMSKCISIFIQSHSKIPLLHPFRKKCVRAKLLQSCPTLCDSMDCSPPGSSVHGILEGKNTGVDCHSLLQRIFPTQGSKPSLLHCRQILYGLSHQGGLMHQKAQQHSNCPSLSSLLKTSIPGWALSVCPGGGKN